MQEQHCVQEVIMVIKEDLLFLLVFQLDSIQFFPKLSPLGHTQCRYRKTLKGCIQFDIQLHSNQ